MARMRMTYPEAEHRRLEAVRSTGLLDTKPEQAYDDLVQLAACICQVPISLVTLVDEHRLWLKARVGVPIAEVPRDFSFCSYTIQQDDFFVIPDTLKDPRYAANAAVTGAPSIRFYAGYPLSNSSGEKLGSLCVVDSVPRELNGDQQTAMHVLGRQVMAQIELKQRLDAVHTALQQKQLAEAALQSSQRMLESANAQLLQLSLTDPLTGLENRRAFETALDREFHRSRRSEAPLSLLMLDIDFFKSFNDTYGHVRGDEVLRQVGSLIRACSRKSDITARYGGEEFVVILSQHRRRAGPAAGWTSPRCDLYECLESSANHRQHRRRHSRCRHADAVRSGQRRGPGALPSKEQRKETASAPSIRSMFLRNRQTTCPTCPRCPHLKRRRPAVRWPFHKLVVKGEKTVRN